MLAPEPPIALWRMHALPCGVFCDVVRIRVYPFRYVIKLIHLHLCVSRGAAATQLRVTDAVRLRREVRAAGPAQGSCSKRENSRGVTGPRRPRETVCETAGVSGKGSWEGRVL